MKSQESTPRRIAPIAWLLLTLAAPLRLPAQAPWVGAVRVTLPGAIIKTPAELEQWLSGVRIQVEEKLKTGPVIL